MAVDKDKRNEISEEELQDFIFSGRWELSDAPLRLDADDCDFMKERSDIKSNMFKCIREFFDEDSRNFRSAYHRE